MSNSGEFWGSDRRQTFLLPISLFRKLGIRSAVRSRISMRQWALTVRPRPSVRRCIGRSPSKCQAPSLKKMSYFISYCFNDVLSAFYSWKQDKITLPVIKSLLKSAAHYSPRLNSAPTSWAESMSNLPLTCFDSVFPYFMVNQRETNSCKIETLKLRTWDNRKGWLKEPWKAMSGKIRSGLNCVIFVVSQLVL